MDVRSRGAQTPRTPMTTRSRAAATPKKATLPTEPVGVYCRLKPLLDGEEEICARKVLNHQLLLDPPESSQSYKSGHRYQTKCTFRKVFDTDADQKDVFADLCVPLIDDVLKGKNGLLFAYGITGSGKTHTMIGDSGNGGMLPRSLDTIFNSIGHLQAERCVFKPDKQNGMNIQNEFQAKMEQQRNKAAASQKSGGQDCPDFMRIPDSTKISGLDEDNAYAVFVSFVEIYNNYIYDLLEEPDADEVHQKPPQSKNLREDHRHNMYVSGANEYEVKSTEEAYELLWRGQQRRRVAQTQLNHESSRSHSVFTIRVVQAPVDATGAEILNEKSAVSISQLSLVDLAGSERASRTQAFGGKLKEAGNINAALMVLRKCMETLRDNQMNGTSRIVPYRDSKLTHIFKNYFDGEGKVRMIVCISPTADEYDESLHVMRFAELTQEVEVAKPTVMRSLENGLEPGRRNAHKLYKEAMERLEEMERKAAEAPVEAAPPPPHRPFEPLLPHEPITFTFPHIAAPELVSSNDSTVLPSFVEALKEKQAMRRRFLEELELKKRQFRDYLGQIDGNYGGQRQALENAHDALRAKEGEIQKIEKRARVGEQKAVKEAVALERERNQQESERRMNQVKQTLEARIHLQEDKLRKMKQIVKQRRQEPPPPPPPPSASAATPDPTRQAPAVKARHRKRSFSADLWLEHKPHSHLSTDQVLQPRIKKKKTVNSPKIKDLKEGGCSKYVLAHQEQDSMGEVETHLFKGEVWKTRGGGAAVQFTDIEKLKSENPITATDHHHRKRSETRGRDLSDDEDDEDDEEDEDESVDSPDPDVTDVQTRCAFGIEGKPGCAPAYTHTSPKKKK
ncbi:kinesin-like protein KIF23 isoform X2 [Oscarella lobularis]|uniref:kinesin-like protein KIF23 isoform X2 n=1 Tax=Oscarella lobularis TaxID=121494 RepID=UPI00331405CF